MVVAKSLTAVSRLFRRRGRVPRGTVESVQTPLGRLEPMGADQIRRARRTAAAAAAAAPTAGAGPALPGLLAPPPDAQEADGSRSRCSIM